MMFLDKDPREATLAILRLACFGPNATGELVNEGGFTGLVESLAPHFKRIEVVAPVVPRLQVSQGLRPIRADNVVMRALPDMKGLARSWARSRRALRLLDSWASNWDLVNLRAPDNFLPVSAPWLRRHTVPHYVQMVSHPFDAGQAATQALPTLARPLGAAAWNVQRRAIRAACRDRVCIAHGEALCQIASEWGADAYNLPSGSLSRHAIDPTPRAHAPRRVLFVGRLNTEKGLLTLVEALAQQLLPQALYRAQSTHEQRLAALHRQLKELPHLIVIDNIIDITHNQFRPMMNTDYLISYFEITHFLCCWVFELRYQTRLSLSLSVRYFYTSRVTYI